MKLKFTAAAAMAGTALALSFACTQPAGERIAGEQPVEEQTARQQTTEKLSPMAALEKRFQEFDLNVGDPFPEVEIYDAQGKPFNTRSLKGKYTVIVNGCLT